MRIQFFTTLLNETKMDHCHDHTCCSASAFHIPEEALAAFLAGQAGDDADSVSADGMLSMNQTAGRQLSAQLNLKPEVVTEMETMRQMRRLLHSWPELGFLETKTSAFIEEQLRKLPNVDVYTGIGVTGIIGIYRGTNPGPTIAFRADIVGFAMTSCLTRAPGDVSEFEELGHLLPSANLSERVWIHSAKMIGPWERADWF